MARRIGLDPWHSLLLNSMVVLVASSLGCTGLSGLPPAVERVEPDRALEGESPTVIIHGRFLASLQISFKGGSDSRIDTQFSATLGGVELETVTYLDSERIIATVPATLAVGQYDLMVTDPEGRTATRAMAFTVAADSMISCTVDGDCVDPCSSTSVCVGGTCGMGVADKDTDGDGFVDAMCPGGDDCDDDDDTQFPGQTFYADCDNDGLSSELPVLACDLPSADAQTPCADGNGPDGGWSNSDPGANADCDDEAETCTDDCVPNTDTDAFNDCADACVDADGDGWGPGHGGGCTVGSNCDPGSACSGGFSRWRNRQQLIFDNRASNEDLIDFPVLVRLTAADVDFGKTLPSGADIRFADSDGTPLNYEIETWDDGTASATIWVQVPQIDRLSNTDFIYMYFNNTGAVGGRIAPDVWEPGVGVWHLADNPGPGGVGEMMDSDVMPNDGTAEPSMARDDLVAGRVGDAIDFDGVDDYIDFPSTDMGNAFTIQAWVMPDSGHASLQTIVANSGPGVSTNGFRFFVMNNDVGQNGRIRFETGNGSTAGSSRSPIGQINFDQWNHLAVVVNRTTGSITFYHDGVDVTEDGTIRDDFGVVSDWEIGRMEGDLWFRGLLDEVRISSALRSADFIEACFLSQNGAFAFVTFGLEETGRGAPL